MSNKVVTPLTRESGLYDKGFLHKDGGIEVTVKSPDGVPERKVEVEVKEFLLCEDSLNSDKVYEFKNKTNLEILDEMFQDANCTFKTDTAYSGDFIFCRLVVLDGKKRDIKGTVKQITDKLQSEKSCRITNGVNAPNETPNRKLGGQLADKDHRLIGVHNLWFEYLIFADEMGGLPMPSLAIINPNIPFSKYGEITLVAPKDLYDPKESSKK